MSNRFRKLANLLGAAVILWLAACILAVGWRRLTSSDLTWLPNLSSRPQPDDANVWFAARFQRQQEAEAVAEDAGPLRCRLAPWSWPVNLGPPPELLLELANTSTEAVRLWYLTGAECHITFLLRHKEHGICGSITYGNRPHPPVVLNRKTGRPEPLPAVLTLQPGDTYSVGIYLHDLRDGCSGPGAPGSYLLQAVFLYEDIEGFPQSGQRYAARSTSVAIEVRSRLNDGRLDWHVALPPARP